MPIVVKIEWWLMDCSLPDLNWARMRSFENESVDVLDSDGKTHSFKSEEEAHHWLAEDEFVPLVDLQAEDLERYGIDIDELHPPQGETEAKLLPTMLQRRSYAER